MIHQILLPLPTVVGMDHDLYPVVGAPAASPHGERCPKCVLLLNPQPVLPHTAQPVPEPPEDPLIPLYPKAAAHGGMHTLRSSGDRLLCQEVFLAPLIIAPLPQGEAERG